MEWKQSDDSRIVRESSELFRNKAGLSLPASQLVIVEAEVYAKFRGQYVDGYALIFRDQLEDDGPPPAPIFPSFVGAVRAQELSIDTCQQIADMDVKEGQLIQDQASC